MKIFVIYFIIILFESAFGDSINNDSTFTEPNASTSFIDYSTKNSTEPISNTITIHSSTRTIISSTSESTPTSTHSSESTPTSTHSSELTTTSTHSSEPTKTTTHSSELTTTSTNSSELTTTSTHSSEPTTTTTYSSEPTTTTTHSSETTTSGTDSPETPTEPTIVTTTEPTTVTTTEPTIVTTEPTTVTTIEPTTKPTSETTTEPTTNPTTPDFTSTITPETTTSTDPCNDPNIKIINLDSTDSTIYLEWNCRTECDYEYEIEINGNSSKIKDCSITIKNLQACTTYYGSLQIRTVDYKIIFNKTTLVNISKVKNLQKISNDNTLKITWQPESKTQNCVKFYKYVINQDDNIVWESYTKETHLVYFNPNKCVNHTFLISAAVNNTYMSEPEGTSYNEFYENDPPTLVSATTAKTSATTEWSFMDDMCAPKWFYFECKTANSIVYQTMKKISQEDKNISVEIFNLEPYTNYTFRGRIENTIGTFTNWSETYEEYQTLETEPESPEKFDISQLPTSQLLIKWSPPNKWNGIKIGYLLTIEFLNLNFTPIFVPNCSIEKPEKITKNLNKNTTQYTVEYPVPSAKYFITLNSISSGGSSNILQKYFTTKEEVPIKPIFNYDLKKYSIENYNVTVDVSWNLPCKQTGHMVYYDLELIGSYNGQNYRENETITISTCESSYNRIFHLKPAYMYDLVLTLNLENLGNNASKRFESPAGIPGVSTTEIQQPNATLDESGTMAFVYLHKDYFNENMGKIISYSIIVAPKGCEELPRSGQYEEWPEISSENNKTCNYKVKAYQATENGWYPFKNGETIFEYVLGGNSHCTDDMNPCNRKLIPGTNYSVKYRGFTKNGFSDTKLIYFQTVDIIDSVQLGLIIGLIVGILGIACIIAAVLYYTRGKLNFSNWPRMDSTSQISPAPQPVSIKKFGTHYAKMIENSGKIKNEFQLLSTISSDVTLSTKTAMLPINRKKNRYINILPYDQTRVKLLEERQSSDFINASFIQGYTGNNEYIATQGPTEATCPSFWQMVLEQNIRVIIMLTQFVESGKDKCYKYFPDANAKEGLRLLNDFRILCINETSHSIYVKRTFKLIKGSVTKNITHLQFTQWPDFGVPSNVSQVIQFCKHLKELKVKKPGYIVIHCSAGVGRTGTLIALDILLQSIKDKRKVDIFGTVLNLRKQRMFMVQSEKQYEFLYKCINYVISNGDSNHEIKVQVKNEISETNML